MRAQEHAKGVRDIQASHMTDGATAIGAIADDNSIVPSFHIITRTPTLFEIAWIYAGVPILLPKCLSYVVQSLHYNTAKKSSVIYLYVYNAIYIN